MGGTYNHRHYGKWVLGLLCFVGAFRLPLIANTEGAFVTIMADGGGWVTGIQAHESGVLYARTDVGGVYRSDDSAASWQWISGSAVHTAQMYVQGLAVHPENADTLFVTAGTKSKPNAPGRGVWRSVDAGQSWDLVLGSATVGDLNFSGNDNHRWGGPTLIFDPQDASHETLWAGSHRSGLFKSTDGGDSWSEVGAGLFDDSALMVVYKDSDPAYNNHLWVGGGYYDINGNPPVGEGGIWFSADNGQSFTKILNARMVFRIVRRPATGDVFVTFIDSAGSARLNRISATNWSDSQTFTFTDLTSALGSGQNEISLLTVLDDGRLVAGYQNKRTAISSDNGNTWTPLAMGIHPSATAPAWRKSGETVVAYGRNQLIQDPLDSSRWILTTGFGVEVSEDEGASWTPASHGITEVVTFKPKFHPTDPNLIFIPCGDLTGILITDGGASARGEVLRGDIPLWPNDAWNSINIEWGLGSSSDWTVLGTYFNNNVQYTVSSDSGASWLSTDGSNALGGSSGLPNWSPVIASLHTGDEWLVALQQNVYRSTNGGQTYTQVLSTGFSGDSFSGYDNLQRGVGDTRYFYRLYGGLYRSSDRGQNWSQVSLNGTYGTVVADPANPSTLYAILYAFWPVQNGQSLQRSTDAGDTWQVVGDFTVLDEGSVSEYPRIDVYDGRVAVWARKGSDTHRKIYYSEDSGASWSVISQAQYQFPDINGLAIDLHREGWVWVATGGRTASYFRPFESPLYKWTYEHFEQFELTGDAAIDADPDEDGIINLIEYAVEHDPLSHNAAHEGLAVSVIEDAGETYLSLSVNKNPSATDITYTVEVSSDPGNNWVSGASHTTTLTNTAETLTVRDNHALSSGEPRFIRVRVDFP